MDDFDFSIRNEVDSVARGIGNVQPYPNQTPQFFGQVPPPPVQDNQVTPPPSPTTDPYLANLMGQLQGYLGSIQQQKPAYDGGFNSTLKWLLIGSFVIWLIFSYKNMIDRTQYKRVKINSFKKFRNRSPRIEIRESDGIDNTDESGIE